jgi:hypothetical protein
MNVFPDPMAHELHSYLRIYIYIVLSWDEYINGACIAPISQHSNPIQSLIFHNTYISTIPSTRIQSINIDPTSTQYEIPPPSPLSPPPGGRSPSQRPSQ